ncbi:MAG: hypothetical protein HY361_00705 [Candidatus Aenigmarchaeota archaeon]|nr:hypothetical protein [Candidatus Aenigmarchaeota archaeon]
MVYIRCINVKITNSIFLLVFLLSLSLTEAQETQRGVIYTLTASPHEPIVFEDLALSMGVNNPDTNTQNYKLKLIITKGGQVKHQEEFTFSLKPGNGITFSPTYVPDDIGDFEIIAKLYDSLEVELRDLKVITVSVISEIGPFDLDVDVASNVIRPATKVPVILSLANMGDKATDVQVKLEMPCENQPPITQDFFIFLWAGAVVDRTIAMDTCNEVGLHEILASIILFNKTWISSLDQFFINETFIELLFDLPEVIQVKAGQSKIIDLTVKNTGNIIIRNLKLLIPRIPPQWVKITPNNIIETEPEETVLFLINITIPSNITSSKFPIGISAAADETLTRKEATFEVLALEGKVTTEISPVVEEKPKPEFPKLQLPEIPPSAILIGGGIISFVAIGIRLRKHMKARSQVVKPVPQERAVILSKLKTTIEKKRKNRQ